MTKFLRFSLVGILNAAIYAIATQIFLRILKFDAGLSGFLGYMVAIPFAYWAHRVISFRVGGGGAFQLVRFIGVQALGLFVSSVLMWLFVEKLQQSAIIGIVATIAVVPLFTFLVLDRLVFSSELTH